MAVARGDGGGVGDEESGRRHESVRQAQVTTLAVGAGAPAGVKSKVAVTLLSCGFVRFGDVPRCSCFIDVFLWAFQLLHPSGAFFSGSRTNVFLFGKAETAVETRQVF